MSDIGQRSALEQLPKEIKSAVFAALPDVQSLRHAILTGRELYVSFKTDEASIVRQVLGQQIPRGVLEDAVTVREAKLAKSKGWNFQQIDRLFKDYHYGTEIFLQACNLSKALELARFYRIVQGFSKRLADQAMRSASEKYPRGGPVWVANQEELVRIERAFYRFELYCIFFGNTEARLIQPGAGQRKAFWVHFAPWEIEQLACIYEHVQLEISPVFDNLALIAQVWTEFASITGILTDARDEFLQAQMTLGLEHAHGIVKIGNTIMQNHSLPLPRRDEQCFDSQSIEDSLNHAIDLGDSPTYLTLYEIEQNPEEAKRIIKSPFSVDLNTGPEAAWRWAHRNVSPDFMERSGFVLGDAQAPLRECGYVFWNRERLEEWPLFDRPWEGPDPVEILNNREQKVDEIKQKLYERTEELIKAGTLRRGLWL